MTKNMAYLSRNPGEVLDLTPFDPRLRPRHLFAKDDVEAINAALAAGRPLLLRGEPGAGKSQLARAAAMGLKRAFVGEVIDARTEARDLLWSFDAVRRLADAQVLAATRKEGPAGEDPLAELRYVTPGPLWWAFAWGEAEAQATRAGAPVPPVPDGCAAVNGVVVLLDEIDKADSSVPNGLLGALGDGQFTAPQGTKVVCGAVPPLVVVTTNEERSLPDAFLRRCVVHHLRVPSDPQALHEWLVARGRAHFPDLAEDVLAKASEMVAEDRNIVQQQGLVPPGGAEYLDLLRIVHERRAEHEPLALLELVRGFVLRKHPGEERA